MFVFDIRRFVFVWFKSRQLNNMELVLVLLQLASILYS